MTSVQYKTKIALLRHYDRSFWLAFARESSQQTRDRLEVMVDLGLGSTPAYTAEYEVLKATNQYINWLTSLPTYYAGVINCY